MMEAAPDEERAKAEQDPDYLAGFEQGRSGGLGNEREQFHTDAFGSPIHIRGKYEGAKGKPKVNTHPERHQMSDFEEGMDEEEQAPMTEAQAKFVEGLKAGQDCYTTDKSFKGKDGESTTVPGADEGKPAPKKMADLLKEAQAKFQENLIKNSAPAPGNLTQAKASFAEGLKNHCKKGK